MFYKLLGMLVWKGVKLSLRLQNRPKMAPTPAIAGAFVLVGLLVGLLFAKRDSD